MELYNKMIDSIQDREIKTFVSAVIENNKMILADKEKNAYEVYKWVTFILRNDKILSSENAGYSTVIDVLKAASILHNCFYTYGEEDFTKIFSLRMYIDSSECKEMLPPRYIDSICQAVECQLGKDTPVSLLIPNPNTPGSQFSLACSIYYKTGNTVDFEEE